MSSNLYCIGSPKMVAVPYIGQKDPVIIGEKIEVENWLKDFWASIYKNKKVEEHCSI